MGTGARGVVEVTQISADDWCTGIMPCCLAIVMAIALTLDGNWIRYLHGHDTCTNEMMILIAPSHAAVGASDKWRKDPLSVFHTI